MKRLLIAILVLLMSACAAPTLPPRADVLTVLAPKGSVALALEGAAAAYAQSGGGVVQIEALGADTYTDTLSAALLSGSVLFDLVYLPAGQLAKWAGYNALRPIPGELVDPAGFEPWLAAVSAPRPADGAPGALADRSGAPFYGLPTEPGFDVLWLRADLLAAAGVEVPDDPRAPLTWDWVLAAAQAMHNPPERYGAVTAGSELTAGQDFAALLAGLGGSLVDADYRVTVDGPQGQQALRYYAALSTLSSPKAQNFTRAEVISALQNGQAGLGVAPLSAAAALLDCAKTEKLCKAGERSPLRWVWLPGLAAQNAAFGDLAAWAIPYHAARAGEAARFAAWLVSEPGARAWAASGGIPAHRVVLGDMPAVVTLPGETAAPRASAPVPPLAGYSPGWVADHRAAFPPITTGDQVWAAAHTAAHAVAAGAVAADAVAARAFAAATPEAPVALESTLNTAAREMRSALRQAGYPAE